ncbi:MAG: Sua5/YciO/YrdC/YwlC family protein [Alteromonas sp.]|jgi:L-threonylcarbamoyladenylate synthase|uniref:Sua5/YciO/YrdC/YwlC family protein n=1 Tax=Alteromonas sp. TaxID=232 RepID=UPI0032D91BE0
MSDTQKGQVDIYNPVEVEQTSADPVVEAFHAGKLLVYPTEAVMGIGCDPDNKEAVELLLQTKQRSVEKGVILIAANYSQLLPYVNDEAVLQHRRTDIFSSWPGSITWLLPKSKTAPYWITGSHDKIAVRVTNHPLVADLCNKVGKPIVSTSANLAGQSPTLSIEEARSVFEDSVTYVNGEVGGNKKPSTIRDGDTGEIIRS